MRIYLVCKEICTTSFVTASGWRPVSYGPPVSSSVRRKAYFRFPFHESLRLTFDEIIANYIYEAVFPFAAITTINDVTYVFKDRKVHFHDVFFHLHQTIVRSLLGFVQDNTRLFHSSAFGPLQFACLWPHGRNVKYIRSTASCTYRFYFRPTRWCRNFMETTPKASNLSYVVKCFF